FWHGFGIVLAWFCKGLVWCFLVFIGKAYGSNLRAFCIGMMLAWFWHGCGMVLAGSGMVVTCFHWESLWIKFACLLHWNDAGMVLVGRLSCIGRVLAWWGVVFIGKDKE